MRTRRHTSLLLKQEVEGNQNRVGNTISDEFVPLTTLCVRTMMGASRVTFRLSIKLKLDRQA